MAVFTAIASAIISVLSSTITFSAAFAAAGTFSALGIGVSVLAGGIALATAKATGLFKAPGIQQAKDPGVKVQLAPSTDNRIPVFYGRVNTGALIVDAEIKNQNNTMVYCMVIGEKTDTGSYSIQEIKRGDATLNFSGGYASATSSTVISQTDPNATSSTNVNGKMRCRVYAGNAQSSVNQIFPPLGTKVAAQTLMTTIDATTNYEDLVYAIFELDYDVENGLTQIGQLTFDIANTLHEPSNVLLDYLQNDRYGAGLSNTDIVLSSFDDMYDYSNINGLYGNVDYTTTANVTAYHSRWQIDGMLSTYQDVKTNIDQICQSASTFFTYDNKNGKFKVVPNKEATTAEKNAAFVFNDDNILSKIGISSTELYSMYNSIEAEFPRLDNQDQTDIVIVSTPSGDRNTNEPDNPLNTRYDLVNLNTRVHNLANIDLRQSRLSTLVEFEADYSALQVDVGDIVKVTNTLYGFSDKLFRVMRVAEIEGGQGMLRTKIVLLEYDDSVYAHNTVQSSSAIDLSGIPGWFTGIWGNIDYSNIANIIGNITIVDDPLGNVANIVDPPTGNVTSNVDIGNIDIGIGGIGIGAGGGVIPSINFPITIPDIPGISHIIANLNPTGSTSGSNVANIIPPTTVPIMPPAGNTTFTPGETINVTIPQPVMPLQDQSFSVGPLLPDITANLDLSMINVMGVSSKIATAPNITLAPKGKIERGSLGSVQAGLQIEEDLFNDAMANSAQVSVALGTDAALVQANDIIDAGAIDEGIFSSSNGMVPYGTTNDDGNTVIAYQPFRTITYKPLDIAADGKMTANTTIPTVLETFTGTGLISSGIVQLTSFEDNFEYEISRARGNAAAVSVGEPPAAANLVYMPANITVGNWANTNLSNLVQSRRLDVTNSDKRISKSDEYLDIGGFF